MSQNSFFRRVANRYFKGRFRGRRAAESARNPGFKPTMLRKSAPIDAYSAAADSEDFTETNEGFMFAADIMKSRMRGTISDLKREPLKTP